MFIKKYIKGGGFPEGLANLREWQEREGVFFRRGFDTLMHTVSSRNNLKVTTNCYKKRCLLVITKNKKHSLKQVVPITYTLEKIIFAPATF